MTLVALVPTYFVWHYTRALADLVRLWTNFLWFAYHFFSVPLLARTLFAPWRRLGETRSRIFSLEDWGGALVVNTMMRLVGALIRSVIIVTGLAALVLVVAAGVCSLVIWVLLPAGLLVLFIVGVKAIIA